MLSSVGIVDVCLWFWDSRYMLLKWKIFLIINESGAYRFSSNIKTHWIETWKQAVKISA